MAKRVAISPIRGRPRPIEESKVPVRVGSPIETPSEKYLVYAGDLNHEYNLKKETRMKIFRGCNFLKSENQKKTFYNELTTIKGKIGLGINVHPELQKKGNKEQQLKLFDDFLNAQLDILCKEGETHLNQFYTLMDKLLFGDEFANAFKTIPFIDEEHVGKEGGSKTRKKCRRFRNNLRKNKISRKYIMLKQCGGGKAKMGAKSKPYSSKRKAMKSRRRVCYYKKKGRTLKLKKKAKKSRKKSRRRRRR